MNHHMFWLTEALSHLGIKVLNLLVCYSSAPLCAFFKSYSGPLLLVPNTVFERLHSIPCFRSTFRISVWLILSTIFFFSITYPTKIRNDHVENFNPSFLGLVEAIRTISFSISSVIFGSVCLCFLDTMPSIPWLLNLCIHFLMLLSWWFVCMRISATV